MQTSAPGGVESTVILAGRDEGHGRYGKKDEQHEEECCFHIQFWHTGMWLREGYKVFGGAPPPWRSRYAKAPHAILSSRAPLHLTGQPVRHPRLRLTAVQLPASVMALPGRKIGSFYQYSCRFHRVMKSDAF